MVQLSQGDVRRYVGVASTVIGLVCYALSCSFKRLYGEWNSFKICAYIMSSSIICLAILFPKAWQHLSIFEYRAHMAFLVMTSTTVYSFYLDRKMNTKPDAYGPVSSAAFATTSLCMSKQVECGFVDLMYFFCGVLITQLMKITPLLGFAGIGLSYFLVILRSYLDDAPPNRSQSQPPQEATVIDMASLLQSSALDARPQEEEGEEEEGSNQNQEASRRSRTKRARADSFLTNPGNIVESNQESTSSPTDPIVDKITPDSEAPVVAPATTEALAVVPVNQKTKRSELVQRRTRRPFSVSEVEALVQAVEQLGTGRWRDVKLRAFENADHRTYLDLKDKWKTLVHTARIPPQQRRGEPVPQELLDRVLAAHAYWSQYQAKQHGKLQAASGGVEP